jgi:hypothetical protein
LQNRENENFRSIGKGEANTENTRGLKVGGGQTYDLSSD